MKHGIDEWGDGPYGFTSPALVNTIYGRWWHPLDEKPGPNPVPDSPLPWTGDFQDGLGNKIYDAGLRQPAGHRRRTAARPTATASCASTRRTRRITFECWPRFSDAKDGDKAQFPGWPITVAMADNDGRKPAAWLPGAWSSRGGEPRRASHRGKDGRHPLHGSRPRRPLSAARLCAGQVHGEGRARQAGRKITYRRRGDGQSVRRAASTQTLSMTWLLRTF